MGSIAKDFRRFKLRKGAPFRRRFYGTLYGRKVAMDPRDRRAYLLTRRNDGTGLQAQLIELVKSEVGRMSSPLFFDIGANYGEWSLALRDFVQGIVAVEPHPKLGKLLRYNLSGLKNVEIQPIAIGHSDGISEFFFRRGYSGGSSLHPEYLSGLDSRVWWGIGKMAKTRVECREAGSFLEEALARFSGQISSVVLKIDTEGSEGAALPGLERFLTSVEDWLVVIEFNPEAIKALGDNPEELWKQLTLLGNCRSLNSKEPNPNQLALRDIPISTDAPRQNSDVIITRERSLSIFSSP